jgi:hypothetical protein
LEGQVNNWDDYFFVDVDRERPDTEVIRREKDEATADLVDLIPEWRKSTSTLEEDWGLELSAAWRTYLRLYFERIERLARGDFSALTSSPIDSQIVSQIVEMLLDWNREHMELQSQRSRILAFFDSSYFRDVPCESISAGLFSLFKDRIKRGRHQNLQRAKNDLKGLFFDVDSISIYAPYCDAMFIDRKMFALVCDRRLHLFDRFKTKFFSASNWNEFFEYLDSIEERKTEELEDDLKLVYP